MAQSHKKNVPVDLLRQEHFFELFLHDSNTYLFALSNGPFRIVKRSVSHCQMDHFATSNGMYLKRIDNQLVTHPFRKESYYELYLHKLFIFFPFKLVFPCFPGVDLSMSVRIRRFRNLLPQAPAGLSLAAKTYPRQVAKYAKIPQRLFLSLVEHNLCALCDFARGNYL